MGSSGRCIIRTCSSRNDPSVQLFRFPKDPHFKKLWAKSINISETNVTSYSRLCVKHFISPYLGKRRVRKDALPTENLGDITELDANCTLSSDYNCAKNKFKSNATSYVDKKSLEKEIETEEPSVNTVEHISCNELYSEAITFNDLKNLSTRRNSFRLSNTSHISTQPMKNEAQTENLGPDTVEIIDYSELPNSDAITINDSADISMVSRSFTSRKTSHIKNEVPIEIIDVNSNCSQLDSEPIQSEHYISTGPRSVGESNSIGNDNKKVLQTPKNLNFSTNKQRRKSTEDVPLYTIKKRKLIDEKTFKENITQPILFERYRTNKITEVTSFNIVNCDNCDNLDATNRKVIEQQKREIERLQQELEDVRNKDLFELTGIAPEKSTSACASIFSHLICSTPKKLSMEQKDMACTLYRLFPDAYGFMRAVWRFNLPHVKTVLYWRSKDSNIYPEINEISNTGINEEKKIICQELNNNEKNEKNFTLNHENRNKCSVLNDNINYDDLNEEEVNRILEQLEGQ